MQAAVRVVAAAAVAYATYLLRARRRHPPGRSKALDTQPQVPRSAAERVSSAAERLIQRLYTRKSCKVVIATTGSGGSAIQQLCSVPGMSSIILEISIPYSKSSSLDFISPASAPEKFVSPDMAIALAKASLRRATRFGSLDAPADSKTIRFLGVGCTAAVRSSRPKRGRHQAFVAITNGKRTWVRRLLMNKSYKRTRAQEDQCVGALVLYMLARAVGVDPGDAFVTSVLNATAPQRLATPGGLEVELEAMLSTPSS